MRTHLNSTIKTFISVLASKFSFFCGAWGGAWGFKAYGTCFHGFQGRILIPSCSAVEDISLDRPVEIFEGKEGIKELQEWPSSFVAGKEGVFSPWWNGWSVCGELASDSPGRYMSRDTYVHDVPFIRIILDDVPIRCRNDVQYCTVPPYHFSNNVNNLRSVTYTITSIISGNVLLIHSSFCISMFKVQSDGSRECSYHVIINRAWMDW